MRLPYRKFFQTDESSDAVLQMDDQIAFGEFAEIDLGAVTFGAIEAAKAFEDELRIVRTIPRPRERQD